MSRKRFVRAFNWGMAASMIIGLGVMQNLTAQVSIKRAVTGNAAGTATQMDQMWDTAISAGVTDKTKWFRDAKFGIFIHWGLYSKLGGEWKDKRYYGSGEWIMNQAKIPVKQYAALAKNFNPVSFDANQWAELIKESGARYMVITAKHHEGFSMFDSKVTPYDIVDGTPYKKDPMKALAAAARKRGLKFGFYYSQFQDWYEPDGGRNTWDYDESKKDYQKYYRQKAIPQIKELLTHYGPVGMIWFDTPGGMTRDETRDFVHQLRQLQPDCLFSSRVGQGMGDYKDYGDSEVPPGPMKGPWESIYTHNDTWGYISHDFNFKSPTEIIQLLATVASRGGNLMLNIGPDGQGHIPVYTAKFLKAVGHWLNTNGESIYGTTAGFVPDQPWGVTTAKPGKLYLQLFTKPQNDRVLVPGFDMKVTHVYTMEGRKPLPFSHHGKDLLIDLPASGKKGRGEGSFGSRTYSSSSPNRVIVVAYKGKEPSYPSNAPSIISGDYDEDPVPASRAELEGQARTQTLTYSHYYGDWKHTPCITDLKDTSDQIIFNVRFTDPGDYRLVLEYSCGSASEGQEGNLEIGGRKFWFRTLFTGEFNKKKPLMFIRHPVAIYSIRRPGIYQIKIRPVKSGTELFKLKSLVAIPIR